MEELCPVAEGKSIRGDVQILISVRVKYCSNLDVLDLPGFVTANAQKNEQDLMKETRELADQVIMEEKDTSIFLIVVSVTTPANQSLACRLAQEVF